MSHVHAYKWKLKAHKTHNNFEKKWEVSMNKITPHLLRDLDAALPAGTECYLCAAARKALNKYRRGYEANVFLDKNKALTALGQRLGRGLRRFLKKDMQLAVYAYQKGRTEKTA